MGVGRGWERRAEEGGGPGSRFCSMHVSGGVLQKESASHHPRGDLVHGTQTLRGAHTRTATDLGVLPFPPFDFLLFL